MSNDFKFQSGPAYHAFPVTKSDSSDLIDPFTSKTTPAHGVMVGAVGNLSFIPRSGVGSITVFSLSPGVLYDIGMTRVFSTATTATSIIALT